jgi:hypothetical protein
MFEDFNFSPNQVDKFYEAALRDFQIAKNDNQAEVIFTFSYTTLIKLAITVCAKNNLRVKAEQGHHFELIKKLADYLNNREIDAIGNEMRKKRNRDLYEGGIFIAEKQAQEYLEYLKKIIQLVEILLKNG